MPPDMMGQRVLLRRRALNWSQKQLAERCGFPYQVISGLERGHQDIYAQRLAILARELGVSADYLLGLTDEDAPPDAPPAPPAKRPRGRTAAAPVG